LIDRALHRGDTQYNGNSKRSKEHYSTQMINTSKPVTSLLQGLQRNSSARLCFYGVSGAGKTAFARHIAEHLGRPLLIRSSSDLLGSYIGQTEARIAKAFQEAERDGAVLLMDEVDSFLPSRKRAQRHYECSMVNEMLVQMERFSGLLIGTTNRLDHLDAAVSRRFDIKLEFYPMNAAQLEEMLQAVCREFGIDAAADEFGLRSALHTLNSCAAVVPGNFATARRKLRICAESVSVSSLAEAISEEAEASGCKSTRTIGFANWG
jgi:SpoVK/Ycf46/Vps4 family AAA+-type ATPase